MVMIPNLIYSSLFLAYKYNRILISVFLFNTALTILSGIRMKGLQVILLLKIFFKFLRDLKIGVAMRMLAGGGDCFVPGYLVGTFFTGNA